MVAERAWRRFALACSFALGCATSEPLAPPAPRGADAGALADAGARVDPVAAPALASPRLSRLWQETRADAAPALARFWEERKGQGPLVEEAASDPGRALVTFLWRGAPGTRYVGILNGPPGSQGEKALDLLPGTDVWFLTARLPRDGRLSYRFFAGDSAPPYRMTIGQMEERFRAAQPDPLDPTVAFRISFFDLPDAPPQPFARRVAGVPEGARVEATIKSGLLHEDRRVLVYTPPGYDPRRPDPYGVVFFLDGEWYGHWTEALVQAPTTLDNLIAEKRIPAVLAVLVDNQGTRDRDLALSEPFAGFLAGELVPWLRRSYRVTSAPEHTVLAGSSLGGLQALFTALRHPEAFGNVLSQSGAFHVGPAGWKPEVIAEESSTSFAETVVSLPRRPVRVWMEAGDFEAATILGSNRHLRDVLRAKGYPVSYREYHGGHDYDCWRGSLADGLIALLSPQPPAPPDHGRSR